MDLPPIMSITLKGVDNETYVGTLFLKNWTSWLGDTFSGWVKDDPTKRHAAATDPHARRPDPTGATYYVIAVVLVYGMSIVMLIASHINRKHAKVLEDRQINKYLQEFQVVRETSSRDSYRNLKRDITAKLKDARASSHAYRGLTKLSLLPLAAVALPTIRENRLSVASKDNKRKYSLSPRCSFSRSSISSKTSSERKHSVLSVQSDRTTGRQVGGNQRSVNPGDRATMKSSGSVDEAFTSAAAKHDAAASDGGGGGGGSGRPTGGDAPGGYTTVARRLSFPYVQQPLAAAAAAGTTRSQQTNKRPVSKRLQRSHHVSAESPGLDARKPPRTANSGGGGGGGEAGHPPATINRTKLSPKEAVSRLHVTTTTTGAAVESSVERGHESPKSSAGNQPAGEALTVARRNIAANLSADSLSRVFPSAGDAQISNVGTFITAASIPVPSVRTSVNNHLLPLA